MSVLSARFGRVAAYLCFGLGGWLLPHRALFAQTSTSKVGDVVWLQQLADIAKQVPTDTARGARDNRMVREPTARIPDTVKPAQYLRHVFGLLAPDTSAHAFFFNQGVADSASAALFTRDTGFVYLRTGEFLRLVGSLRGMRTRRSLAVPASSALKDHANQVFKLSGLIPLGIVDVDVAILDDRFADSIGVRRDGRLIARPPIRHRTKRIFAIAPLIAGVPATNASLLVSPAFMIRTDSIKPTYDITSRGRKVAVNKDGVAILRLGSGLTHFAVINTRSKRTAVSTIEKTQLMAPLADTRIALLRERPTKSQPARYLKILAVGTTSTAAMSADNSESWTPEPGGVHSAHVYTPGKWGGIEIGVWWSVPNLAATGARDVEPLIIIGGQDRETTEPQTMYLLLRERLGDAAMDLLRSRFDIFIFGYWAGGSNDDCSDPEGDAVGCRSQGIERPVMENAAFVADAMKFIYSQYDIKKKATVITVSMGGNVSRLAFLGIENGPVNYLGEQAFESIPNFPSRTVPVRLWVTIDAPHQGAYLPLGVQSWINSLGWLPGLEVNTRFLDAPSSRELLIEHHVASQSCAENCEWWQPDPRTARSAATERGSFILAMRDWGSFPATVDTSIAIASGSFEVPRLNLWKLDSNGRIPLTWEFCSPFVNGCWEQAMPSGTEGQLLRAVTTYDPINNFDVSTSTISPVATPSGSGMTAYNPLGPNALPLHAIDRKIFAMKDNGKKIDGRMRSLIGEVSYPTATFSQIQEPEGELDVGNSASMSKIRHFRSRLEFGVSGEFKVSILGFDKWIPIDIGGASEVLLPTSRKPIAFEAGGYRNTIRDVDTAITNAFGSSISLVLAPRHTFIPTPSALDLSSAFLSSAYQTRIAAANVDADRYGRGKQRGAFHQDDYLDWKPFEAELQRYGSECIYRGGNRTIQRDGVTLWSGIVSPFTFLVCQSQSLEHTFMEEKAVIFLIDRIFNAPPPRHVIDGIKVKIPIPDPRLERVTGVLPPTPWPSLIHGPVAPSDAWRGAMRR